MLIFVHLVGWDQPQRRGGDRGGLGSTATIGQLTGLHAQGSDAAAAEIADLVSSAVRIFEIDAVLDNDAFAPPLAFLGEREWDWNLKDTGDVVRRTPRPGLDSEACSAPVDEPWSRETTTPRWS